MLSVVVAYRSVAEVQTSVKEPSFKRVTTQGPVVFHSAKDTLELAQAAGLTSVSVGQADDGSGKGLSLYRLDLSK